MLYAFILVPIAISAFYGRDFIREARLFESRLMLERRAEEVLCQEELAPRRWAERLAPDELPDFAGFEIGACTSPAPASWPATSTTCSASPPRASPR